VNAINDNDKSFIIQPHTSTILQVTPEALPKFHRQAPLMTSLPQTSTNHQVTPEVLPKFHFSGYAGGTAQILQVNAINDNDKSFTIQPITSMIVQVMVEALPEFHR